MRGAHGLPGRGLHLALVALILLLSACATVKHGPRQLVTISSDPPGATATIEPGGQRVATPAEVELDRKNDYRVRFELAGHATRELVLGRDQSAAMAGNAPIGMIGFAVDATTGAGYELGPDPLHAILDPVGGRAPDPQAQLPLAERSFRVVFFNEAIPTRRLAIDGGAECKLKKNEFTVRELRGGPHHLRIAHWDVVWLDDQREITIDGSFTHVGLILNGLADDFRVGFGLPTPRKQLFREVCRQDG